MTDQTSWMLVSHDLFDRDAAPLVDRRSLSLRDGLKLLWHRTLTERVLPDGRRGFTAFDLRCDGVVIRIPEDFAALERLRGWCADAQGQVPVYALLLETVAAAHEWLHGHGRNALLILELLKRAHDAEDGRHILRLLYGHPGYP